MSDECSYATFGKPFGLDLQANIVSNFRRWFNEIVTNCYEQACSKRPSSNSHPRLCFRVGVTFIGEFTRIPEASAVYVTYEDDTDIIGSLMQKHLKTRPLKYLNSYDNFFIIFTFRMNDVSISDGLFCGKFDTERELTEQQIYQDIYTSEDQSVKVTMTSTDDILLRRSSLRSLKAMATLI